MAGTRGLAKFNGQQIKPKSLRDTHFDANYKLNEDKVDIQWLNHRETLEATKVDVFVQANNQVVAGLTSLDITTLLAGKSVATDTQTEGVVTNTAVELRQTGTADFPFIDTDGDRVYGEVRFDEVESKYFLDFYSEVAGAETAYTFAEDAASLDFRYILRTNLSVIPVDAIVNGGSGFVEGATDANAYMNLTQLMKDIYVGGSLDNDGNGNLDKPLVQQIADEVKNRQDADAGILASLASTLAGEGAELVGVVTDENYEGANVQAVLTGLAARLVELETSGGQEVTDTHTRTNTSANGFFAERSGGNETTEFTTLEERLEDIEFVVDAELEKHEERFERLETEDVQEVFGATGGETGYSLLQVARPNTLFLYINGGLQAPGLHYEVITNGEGNIIGVNFAPDTLSAGDPDNNIPPDWLMVVYKKVFTA